MFNFKDRFWKIISIAAITAIAYLAHGLHTSNGALPAGDSLILSAQSSEIIQVNHKLLVTTGDDGRSIYFWDLGGIEDGTPEIKNIAKHTYRQ